MICGGYSGRYGCSSRRVVARVLLLALLCGVTAHCAAADMAKGTSVPLNIEYQSEDPAVTFTYILSNDSIVFLNLQQTGEDLRYPPGLYLYSIGRNESRRIATDQDDGRSFAIPDIGISGDVAVYRIFGPENVFHLYHITTGSESTVPGPEAWGALRTYSRKFGNITIDRTERADPAIDGDRIVWSQGFSTATNEPGTDLYLMNMTTGEIIPVCERPGGQVRPSISGRYVVWEDMRNGTENPDIYLYDLMTGTETPVCTDPSYQRYPRVSGDYVVWIDFRRGFDLSEVRMFHIPTGTETVLAGGQMRHGLPLISGTRIAYVECIPYSIDDRGICQGYVDDTATGTHASLPPTRYSQDIWGISGDRILYSEDTDKDRQMYLFTLENLTQPDAPQVQATGSPDSDAGGTPSPAKPVPGTTGAAGLPGFGPALAAAAISFAGVIAARRHEAPKQAG